MLASSLVALSLAGFVQAQVDSASTLTLAKRYIGNDFTSGFGEFTAAQGRRLIIRILHES